MHAPIKVSGHGLATSVGFIDKRLYHNTVSSSYNTYRPLAVAIDVTCRNACTFVAG